MVRARIYSARVALHFTEGRDLKIAIMQEKFRGKDTWAHPYYRRPNADIDRELRADALRHINALASSGIDPIFGQKREDIFGEGGTPQNFSGMIILDIIRHSNNIHGYVGTGFKKIQRIPYIK